MAEAKSTDVKVGFDIEGTYGTPVQAVTLLDVVSDDIRGRYDRITSQAKRPARSRRASAAGQAAVEGSMTIEVGYAGIAKLLYSIFGKVATTGEIAPYTHLFTPDTVGPKPITHVKALDSLIFAQSVMPAEATFRAELDAMLMLDLSVQGIYEKVDTRTAPRDTACFGVSAYPASTPFTFVQAAVELQGIESTDCRSFALRYNNALIEKRALRRNRWPISHAGNGPIGIEASLDMYFSSETELRRYMGAAPVVFPFEATTTVLTGSLQLEFASGTNILTFLIPNCEFEAQAPPVAGDDYLMQQITAVGLEDVNGDLQVTLAGSTEANADVILAGTPIVWA